MKAVQRISSGTGSIQDKEFPDDSVAIKINSQNSEVHTIFNIFNNRYFVLLFCFVGLQLSYVTWGVVQEQLMTQEYTLGRFKSAVFCVFMNRFLALFVALALVLTKKFTSNVPINEAPFYLYAPSSISNSLSSFAQYEALKYVSFPTQVLSKSCKLIPVMLVSC